MSRVSVIFIRPSTPVYADTHDYIRHPTIQYRPVPALATDSSHKNHAKSCQRSAELYIASARFRGRRRLPFGAVGAEMADT